MDCTTKLHTLTVKENEVALNIVEGDNGSNGKGIELKAMETKTALDDGTLPSLVIHENLVSHSVQRHVMM